MGSEAGECNRSVPRGRASLISMQFDAVECYVKGPSGFTQYAISAAHYIFSLSLWFSFFFTFDLLKMPLVAISFVDINSFLNFFEKNKEPNCWKPLLVTHIICILDRHASL